LGFLPELSAVFFFIGNGSGNHSQPMLGFLNLFLANMNFVFEILFEASSISLAVIGPRAGGGSDYLADKRSGNYVLPDCSAEFYYIFAKLSCSFF